MKTRFFDEARKILDNECGRASLGTAQALSILHIYLSGAAMDRVGLVFRYAACEMFQRLRLGDELSEQVHHSDNFKSSSKLRARIAWGMYCSETQVISS